MFKSEKPPQCPPGLYTGVCVDVEDQGIVKSQEFGTETHRVRFHIEVNVKEKPMWISRSVSLASGKRAKLPGVLAAFGLDPKVADTGWEPKDVMGRCCQVYVKLNDEGWANITDMTPTEESVSASGTYRRRSGKNDETPF